MRIETGKRLRGVVFDYSVLLVPERNSKVLGELRTALEKLKALGLKLIVFSTHPRPIERELRERGLPPTDLFLTKADVLDASGRSVNKGSGLWLQRAAEHLGVGTHQLAYVGDEVYDWVMAGHAAVFYLHARWSRPLPHKVVAYVAETPTDILTREGFIAHKAWDGAEALKLTRKHRPDLILLDLMLPGQYNGIEVCQKIRREDPNVVIIMITAKDAEEDKVKGFEAGADDYVTKPFGTKELAARINANLKRSTLSRGARDRIIEAGELRLDTKNFTAWVRGEPLSLRLKEFELLAALASEPGELKSREDLAKEVWGHAVVGASRTIDVHIRRLRATLEGKSGYEYIHTVRGVGYRLEVGP